jgi:hypothetical protein
MHHQDTTRHKKYNRRIIKAMQGNSWQNDRCCRWSFAQYLELSITFSLGEPLFCGVSSHLSAVVSGSGGVRTLMQTDPMRAKHHATPVLWQHVPRYEMGARERAMVLTRSSPKG